MTIINSQYSIHENVLMKDVKIFLHQYNSIFFTFVNEMMMPLESDKIPTACVEFSKENEETCINFFINPKFWGMLNKHEKLFIFFHETLHVMLNHGMRGKKFFDSISEEQQNHKILNIAQDICINEIIIKQYMKHIPSTLMPFIRENLHFIDTTFKKFDDVEKGKDFIYYYYKYIEKFGNKTNDDSFDVHAGFFGQELPEDVKEELNEVYDDEIYENIFGDVSSSEDKSPENYFQESGGFSINEKQTNSLSNIEIKKVNKSESLENHLKNLLGKSNQKGLIKKKNIWHKEHRRSGGMMARQGMMLPVVEESKKNYKYRVVAYADVSGSCRTVATKFLSLINDLSKKESFDIALYVFADNVANVTFENDKAKYRGAGGGTNIMRVLNHFNHNYYHKKIGIDAVVVLTDGQYISLKSRKDSIYSIWHFFMIRKSINVPEKSKIINI